MLIKVQVTRGILNQSEVNIFLSQEQRTNELTGRRKITQVFGSAAPMGDEDVCNNRTLQLQVLDNTQLDAFEITLFPLQCLN